MKKKNAEDIIARKLEKIFDKEFFKTGFSEIFISYAFNESILTPGLYYNLNQSDENLSLVYGDLCQEIVLTDHIAEKNLYNTYRIPYDVHLAITNQFHSATFIHQYSLLIKQLQHTGNILKLIFYPNKIVIALQKQDKLQIIQAFKYITAEDVVYHMLNVCNQFNAQDVNVQLNGMIERDSAMFKEIQKYFLNITFGELPEQLLYAEGIKEFPAHFFSHLFSFALCV